MNKIQEIENDFHKVIETNNNIKISKAVTFVSAVAIVGSMASSYFLNNDFISSPLTQVAIGGFAVGKVGKIAFEKIKNKKLSKFMTRHAHSSKQELMHKMQDKSSKLSTQLIARGVSVFGGLLAFTYSAPLIFPNLLTHQSAFAIGLGCGYIVLSKTSHIQEDFEKVEKTKDSLATKTFENKINVLESQNLKLVKNKPKSI